MCATVIAHGNAPPVLDAPEHVFDFVALFIERFIVDARVFAPLSGRDAGHDSFFDQRRTEPVRVIAPIRQQFFCFW